MSMFGVWGLCREEGVLQQFHGGWPVMLRELRASTDEFLATAWCAVWYGRCLARVPDVVQGVHHVVERIIAPGPLGCDHLDDSAS